MVLGSESQFWSKTCGSICENLWSNTFFKTTYSSTINCPETNFRRRRKKRKILWVFTGAALLACPPRACRWRQDFSRRINGCGLYHLQILSPLQELSQGYACWGWEDLRAAELSPVSHGVFMLRPVGTPGTPRGSLDEVLPALPKLLLLPHTAHVPGNLTTQPYSHPSR